jgi:spermidine synthase
MHPSKPTTTSSPESPPPAASAALKTALFATGLAGIVAEYILSTLASYFLGNSVVQWTLTVSVMLFSMGLGSSLSRFLRRDLLDWFIGIELLLSLLSAYAALMVYTISAFSPYTGLLIYGLSIAIGLLIGLEIPLVIRMNEEYQSLRVNIAGVLERDYFGSLLGGLFFAFVGLPYLGMSYTPFVLGSLNYLVAAWLFVFLRHRIRLRRPRLLIGLGLLTGLVLALGFWQAETILLRSEQRHFRDKVILQHQSRYQRIVMTEWKDHYWLYINRNLQLSTIDEYLYHEPLVHPAMQLCQQPEDVLVLGGGDGCALREIVKYPSVERIRMVDLDPAMTRLAREHPVFTGFNDSALYDPRVELVHQDAFTFVRDDDARYDAIVIDLPDPKDVDLNRLYTRTFYRWCRERLREPGFLITQAGSPYYAGRAFRCIDTTLQAAGFATLPMHNQVLSMGEWGWVLAATGLPAQRLRQQVAGLRFEEVSTRWLNHEAMGAMTRFGKTLPGGPFEPPEINRVARPVLYRYYLQGNWDLY